MRKKLMSLVSLVLTLAFVLTGCTTQQTELWQKMQASSDWEMTKVSATGAVNMTVEKETVAVNFSVDGLVNNTTLDAQLKMSLSDNTGMINIKDIEIYMIDGKVYMSKSYIEQIITMVGEPVPTKIAELDAEYIYFTDLYTSDMMGVYTQQMAMYEKMMADPAAIKAFYATYEEIVKQMGIDVEVTKVNETYTIDLDQKEVFDMVKKALVTGTENLGELNKKLGLGLTDADVATLQKEFAASKGDLDEMMTLLEQMVQMNVKAEYTFADNKVTEKVAIDVKEPVMTGMSMKMNVTAVSEKVAPTTITIPGKVAEMTMAEFENMLSVEIEIDYDRQVIIDGSGKEVPCKIITKNGQEYFQATSILGVFGYKVIYNETAKKVGITMNNEFTPINVITEKGVSYISLAELANLGINIE